MTATGVTVTFNTHGNSKQKEAAIAWTDDSVTDIVYGGGKGGAKTYTGVALIFGDALMYPETHYFIARKELNDLRRFTIPSIHEVLNDLGLEPHLYLTWHGQDNFFELPNGSKVFLIAAKYLPGDPQYQRFGSMQMTRGWIEEAGEFAPAAKANLQASIGRWKNDVYGLVPKLLQTCNPSKNYLYIDYYKPFKAGTLDPWKRFIQALPQDNKKLPAGYIENLNRTLSKNEKSRLLLGNWEYEDDPSALMPYDDIISIFTNTHVQGDGKKYMSVDVARFGDDLTKIRIWHGFRVIKKVILKKKNTKEVADVIKMLHVEHQIPPSQIIIDEDGIGCLTENCEVLTATGWKNAKDIEVNDGVYSRQRNGIVSLEKVTRNRIEPDTRIITHPELEFSFSHFLPFKTRKEYKFSLGSWDGISNKSTVWMQNDFIWRMPKQDFYLKPCIYRMPNGGYKKSSKALSITGHDFARFLGWFISEGSLSEGKYAHISQSNANDTNPQIIACLDAIGIGWSSKTSKSGEVNYCIHSKMLHDWLLSNCYTSTKTHRSFTKKVPDWLHANSREVIRVFLNAFMLGDGYIKSGKNYYSTSSKTLKDDLITLVYKSGGHANANVKQKAGSKSKIHGREITRKHDNYCVYEMKNGSVTHQMKGISERIGTVYNICITGESRLYFMRCFGGRPFWSHNGGVIDNFPRNSVKGFIANSKPINPKPNENYENLKAQCAYILSEKVKGKMIYEGGLSPDEQELLIEDLEQIKEKNTDSQGKRGIVSKEEVKKVLGRSPDDGDTYIMRMYFELAKPTGLRVI